MSCSSSGTSSEEEEGRGVSAAWLQTLLDEREGGPCSLIEYSVAPAPTPHQPVLSDILALTLKYRPPPPKPANTLHLVLKLPPAEPYQRYFLTQAQFDLREISFYTVVVRDIEEHCRSVGVDVQLAVPQVYHANYTGEWRTDGPPSSVLVLEDLTALGYCVPELTTGLTEQQATAALVAVASLHAGSLALKLSRDTPLDQTYPFLFQTSNATDSYQQLVDRGLPQLARLLEGRSESRGLMEALGQVKPNTKELISRLLAPSEPMGLITHTDFWCNNLAFTSHQPPKCRILDWQMVTYSRPTNDIALLLASSLAGEVRRAATPRLLDAYWEEFSRLCQQLSVDLPTIYPREKFDSDYQQSQLLAVLLCIGSMDVALGDPTTEHRLLDLLHDLYHDGIFSLDE